VAEEPFDALRLSELLHVFELELARIDSFGFRDEEPALEQLELLTQTLVRRTQPIALLLQLGDTRHELGSLALDGFA
jgi:hypothetical protein